MIRAKNIVKKFNDFVAIEGLNVTIDKGIIYGLVGSNGSGKSTLLRLISGIYTSDSGEMLIKDENVFENRNVKSRTFFVADELYFLPHSTMDDMAKFYSSYYENFSFEKYNNFCKMFPIEPKKKIDTFSKGMKRQVALILALAVQPDYLLLDEAFDGLDPIMRAALKRIISDEISQREISVIISSHNLRELEDICDQVGILHKGKIIFEKDIDELKLGFCKIQAAFKPMVEREKLNEVLDIMQIEVRESLVNMIVRTNKEDAIAKLQEFSPLFAEGVSLTLEEIFINEMEAAGYDYNNVIF